MAAYECSCGVVGEDNFYKNAKYQCKSCWNKRTYQSARDKLDILLDERRAACERCGYNSSRNALQWHHKDPSEKEFGISSRRGLPLDKLREETAKCELLCANCHVEVHDALRKDGPA